MHDSGFDRQRTQEWLEPDGLGGFASGTVAGVRTRRYHALLLAAMKPPGERVLLVNGVEAWLEADGLRLPLSVQDYSPGVTTGGERTIESFTHEPWPSWRLAFANGVRATHELFVMHELPVVVLTWRLTNLPAGATLCVRPLLSGRDPHALHHANGTLAFDAERVGACVRWRTYEGVPAVLALANADYEHVPDWYWRFEYAVERERGLEHEEDLASPGLFRFAPSAQTGQLEATLVLAADTPEAARLLAHPDALTLGDAVEGGERARRAAYASSLERAAAAYVVQRGEGRTVIAGYPWFGDWGRDTFIALRGLCLATGRLDEARLILLEWSAAVSEGMLPNRFADHGDVPEYNAVDASLWFVLVVGEWWDAMEAAGESVPSGDFERLRTAVLAILNGYTKGTRHGIRMDVSDGLLACGEPGVQLTWMDAKVGDWVVTPRIGKPVEVQALWIHALAVGARYAPAWNELRTKAQASFEPRFWNEATGHLNDVVDVDHQPGRLDACLRPNQLFALGGLPTALVTGARARRALERIERALITPLGPRTLAPEHPDYAGRCTGGIRQRDGAYHMGTVWPWLHGAFVEAWLSVNGDDEQARSEAAVRFMAPLRAHLAEAGLGHVSEILDGDAPHTPRGCPFQAWSVGELLRLEKRLAR